MHSPQQLYISVSMSRLINATNQPPKTPFPFKQFTGKLPPPRQSPLRIIPELTGPPPLQDHSLTAHTPPFFFPHFDPAHSLLHEDFSTWTRDNVYLVVLSCVLEIVFPRCSYHKLPHGGCQSPSSMFGTFPMIFRSHHSPIIIAWGFYVPSSVLGIRS